VQIDGALGPHGPAGQLAQPFARAHIDDAPVAHHHDLGLRVLLVARVDVAVIQSQIGIKVRRSQPGRGEEQKEPEEFFHWSGGSSHPPPAMAKDGGRYWTRTSSGNSGIAC